jgi:mRNA interferase MazF
VKRGEIYWANLGVGGRRPALVVSRSAAAEVRSRVTVAPVTRTVRGTRSELPLGPGEGLGVEWVASCDNLLTVDKRLMDEAPVGRLGLEKILALDHALKFALGIRY